MQCQENGLGDRTSAPVTSPEKKEMRFPNDKMQINGKLCTTLVDSVCLEKSDCECADGQRIGPWFR